MPDWPVRPEICSWTVELSGPDGDTLDISLEDLSDFIDTESEGSVTSETWTEVSRSTTTIELGEGVSADRITSVTLVRPNGQHITLQFAE